MNDFVNRNFCRLCLNITEGQQVADLAGDKQVCTILENVFPGMKLDLVQTPKICLACKEKLQFAYIFKNTVLSNEQKINSNTDFFVIAIDMCRLCLKEKLGKGVVYLYENNHCSYSYQLMRTVTEIATAPLKFEIFQKPIMCTECWSTVKDIYAFKKRCFDNEEKLRNLSKKTNNDLNSLSIEEVLTAIILKQKALIHTTNKENNTLNTHTVSISEIDLDSDKEDIVSQGIKKVITYSTENDPILISDSDSDNDLPDSKNTDEHSGSECGEDIFDEAVNDDVVEIRIKSRKHVGDTKLNNVNSKNHDSNIDFGNSENHRLLAEVTGLVKEEISVEEHGIAHNGFTSFKEESISIWETSLVTPSNHHSVKPETTGQHTLSNSSNALTKMDTSLAIHRIDCVKYQSNLNVTNINTEMEPIRHLHTEIRTNNPPKRTIKCGECDFVTSLKEIMTRHMEKHILYSDTGNKCPNCQEVYRNPDILEEHIQSCEGSLRESLSAKNLSKTTRKCGKCSFTTIWLQKFKRHVLQHAKKEKCYNIDKEDNIKPYKTTGHEKDNPQAIQGSNLCNVLKESSLGALKQSTKIDSNAHDRNFVCDICEKAFKVKSSLLRHHITHSEDTKFICDVCQKSFNRKDHLTKHKQVHCDTKDYICRFCHECFKCRRNLTRHLETHRNDKTFICNICQNIFKTKGYLRAHIMSHHTDKNYICDICQKAFKMNIQLKRHRVAHRQDREYVCNICQKGFKRKGYLSMHEKVHCNVRGKTTRKCGKCSFTTIWLQKFKRHVLQHAKKENCYNIDKEDNIKPYKTTGRQKDNPQAIQGSNLLNVLKESSLGALKQSAKTYSNVHDRNFVCDICQKAFKMNKQLKLHRVTHRQDREYVCNICQKGFKRRGYLSMHEKVHYNVRSKTTRKCGKPYKTTGCQKDNPQAIQGSNLRNVLKESSLGALKQSTKIDSNAHDRNFICNICQNIFKTKGYLRAHIMSHHTDKNYICDICQKAFKMNKQLKLHRVTHCQDREYVCNICQKGFKRKGYLSMHEKVHCNVRSKTTRKCGKYSFTTTFPQTFKRHVLQHAKKENCYNIDKEDNIKPYKTTGRQKDNPQAIQGYNLRNVLKESSLGALKQSAKTYSNVHDRNFVCDICQTAFKMNNQLKLHRVTHRQDREYVCNICQKGFKRKGYLSMHEKVHCNVRSKTTRKCGKYSFTTTFPQTFKRHVLQHTKKENCYNIDMEDNIKPYKTTGREEDNPEVTEGSNLLNVLKESSLGA